MADTIEFLPLGSFYFQPRVSCPVFLCLLYLLEIDSETFGLTRIFGMFASAVVRSSFARCRTSGYLAMLAANDIHCLDLLIHWTVKE